MPVSSGRTRRSGLPHSDEEMHKKTFSEAKNGASELDGKLESCIISLKNTCASWNSSGRSCWCVQEVFKHFL